MANEITVSASLAYVDSSITLEQFLLSIASPGTFTIGTPRAVRDVMSVPTTAGGTAIPMGSIVTPGWAIFKNTDAVNYVEILSAVAGTVIARLYSKQVALLPLPPGMVAPAAQANTAAVLLDYLILNH